MQPVAIFSPAKINLFLAITGRRPDGFHDLVSLVAPLAWGDELTVTPADEFSLTCSAPDVPVDAGNLVWRAAEAFRRATGWSGGAAFHLAKRIPVGAGLGGGSSNAVAALRGLNTLAGEPLARAELSALAAELGSDCALFLAAAPVVMRGRGESIAPLAETEAARLRGQRVLVFKPGFGVATAWAYNRMAAKPTEYLPAAVAEARLEAWFSDPKAPVSALLYNNMEGVVFEKFLALPTLHTRLRERFGVAPRMSGSGSASFLVVESGMDAEAIAACIREAWGPATFIQTTFLA